MTLFQFIGLALHEKAQYVWQGQFLAVREERGKRILLYKVDDYYAEVFYDFEKNELVEIRGFRSRSMLISYLHL